jgi:uncharacterized protein YjbJ (UPF0337 family)
MNKDELKGKAENLKGRVKEAFGALSGDKAKEGEGFIERVKGAVREKFGKAKGEVSSGDRPASREDRSVSREDDDE